MKRASVLVCAFAAVMLSGCAREYQTPVFEDIQPNETAFLIPLTSANDKQNQWTTAASLKQNQLSAKRVQIPTAWRQTGRMNNDGQYVQTMQLIKVSLSPETREWTESPHTGTSNANEGFKAETRSSTGILARMTCSAQIDEEHAALFVHWYLGKPLSEVLDNDIRHFISSRFVEEVAKMEGEEFLLHKQDIMKIVRDDTAAYCATRGINITNLGLTDEVTWDNPEIQASLDAKFKSRQDKIAQLDINAKNVAKAEADAKSAQIMSASRNQNYTEFTLRQRELDNQKLFVDKWDGHLPSVTGGGQNLFNLPLPSGTSAPQPAAPKTDGQ